MLILHGFTQFQSHFILDTLKITLFTFHIFISIPTIIIWDIIFNLQNNSKNHISIAAEDALITKLKVN